MKGLKLKKKKKSYKQILCLCLTGKVESEVGGRAHNGIQILKLLSNNADNLTLHLSDYYLISQVALNLGSETEGLFIDL